MGNLLRASVKEVQDDEKLDAEEMLTTHCTQVLLHTKAIDPDVMTFVDIGYLLRVRVYQAHELRSTPAIARSARVKIPRQHLRSPTFMSNATTKDSSWRPPYVLLKTSMVRARVCT